MNKLNKKIFSLFIAACFAVMSFTACSSEIPADSDSGATSYDGEIKITLSDNTIMADGKKVGTDNSKAVYLSNDVIYYEDKDFYESGNPYGEGEDKDKHSAEKANATTVVNITKPGIYRLSGSLSQGQIRVDLGEDAKEDTDAVVTLVMDNADISCEVAPAVLFLNVYECDNEWDTETAQSSVDTTKAGANVIIADGSINNIYGSYVAKIFKDNDEEKKLWKQDGAFYSYMSMNINGESENTGVLNINAANEGLDSELHLTVNGGNINIFSDNDGINTNEDGVSVTTINGGNVHIIAGLGEEGDGIDSNGWLVINGGTVIASANPAADAGLDSDMGSYINGGTVVALGSTMDWAESDSEQVTMNLQFAGYNESDCAIIVTKEDGNVVFAYDPSEDEVVGSNTRRFMGAVVSCSEFATGDSYNVYIGGTVNGSENAGIYDISTVTGFEDARQQAYSGTDVMMRPGGMGGFGGGKGHMDNFDPNNIGERPEGFEMPDGEKFDPNQFNPENIPDGTVRPERNEGDNFEPNIFGEFPNGIKPPDDFKDKLGIDEKGNPIGFEDEGQFDFSNGQNVAGNIAGKTLFFMQDKVNNFSGVSDYTV